MRRPFTAHIALQQWQIYGYFITLKTFFKENIEKSSILTQKQKIVRFCAQWGQPRVIVSASTGSCMNMRADSRNLSLFSVVR